MSLQVPGGNPSALVKGNHIQEFDSLNQLVFNWECWDHFNVEDARNIDLTQSSIDYMHMNSIDVDYDGHLLISSRHLSECTKINRQTGDIIWRLGGVNNQFDFIDDSLLISYQHDFRHVEGKPGHYTLFDNGNYRVKAYSRVVEYLIDTIDMTASKVWEFRLDPDKYSKSMGNAQRLSNGNTLMNWSQPNLPKVIEVTSDGEVVYEANFSNHYRSYRSFRFNWTGMMSAPYLIAEKYPERIRLLFNKFGDTTVNNFRIYAGIHPDSLIVIDSTQNSWLDITEIEKETWNYFRVSAILTDGYESQLSNLDSVFSNYIMKGCNLIYNGDFNLNKYLWELELDKAVTATDTIDNGTYIIKIDSSMGKSDDIKLIQQNIPLIQNRKYIFEFDASIANPKAIKVAFENKRGYPAEYSNIGSVYINETWKRFQFTFTMKERSDLNAQLVFYLGNASGPMHLSNISLTEITEPISVKLNTSHISCPGESDGIISIDASGGYGVLSYTLFPDSISNTSGIFETREAGEYSVKVSDESCREAVYVAHVLIQEPDSLEISNLVVEHLSIDGEMDGKIVVTASGGRGGYNYVLYPDSIQNSTGAFMNLSNGKYHVVINDEQGCGPVVSNEVTLLKLTSLEEMVETDFVRIYPNPGMDKIHIRYGNELGKFSVSIINQQGSIVKRFQVDKPQYQNNEFELNLNDLNSGLYFIRIIGSGRRSGHPIIINQKLIVL